MDLNQFDVPQSSTIINIDSNKIINLDEVFELEEQIKLQYIDFESLGVNLIKDIHADHLQIIFRNMIEFVNENYTAITEYDIVSSSPKKLLQIGNYIYHFITNEAAFNLIPNYLQTYELYTIEQFETHIKNKLMNDPVNFKKNFITVIKSIYDKLNNLKKIRTNVVNDHNYIRLLTKYAYYIELVNYGKIDRFLYNYVMPVLRKNYDQILWRTF